MTRLALPARTAVFLCLVLEFSFTSQAQPASQSIVNTAPSQAVSSRSLSFSGSIPGQADGALTLTFAIYSDQQGSAALWTETQLVQVSGEKYTVMLGSSSADGLPPEIFSADQAHWLGVQVNGRENRFLLVSVPYAMKAVEAERLGGLLPSDFVTTQQLQSILQTSAGPTTGTAPAPKQATGAPNQAAAAGTPPLPATDFTDSNDSEVLLVTQQGTGYAIHAVSSAQPEAIFSENSSLGGTALRGFASNQSGQSIGLLAEVASPAGISALLNNRAGGKILSLRSVGGEVASFDSNGLNVFGQVQAGNFAGSGAGLTSIPPSAVGAQSVNFPGAIVQRDGNGDFSAGQISANNFAGNGFGLINVPPIAVGAQSANFPGTIVQRDGNGDFTAGQISANNFAGNGFGLINVPPIAVGAQSANLPGTIVQRDGNGNFSAGGLNLTGIADFTEAASTAPIKAVLSINTPVSCVASKELLIKTDALPGQQLFICNAAGTGYVLVGDGTAAGVVSLAAGDGSVAIGGSASAPTISVANGGVTTAKLAPNAVTSANIANGSITSAQLAANAVTSVNLAPNAVTAVNIADGTLSPAKITGTAATLGSNTFSGNQIVQGSLTAASLGTGAFSATSATFSGGGNSDNQVSIKQPGSTAALIVTANGLSGTTAINASSIEGDAIDAQTTFNFAVKATSTNGVGVLANGGDVGLESTGTNFGVKAGGATALVGNGTNLGLSANASAPNGVAISMSTGTSGKFLSGSSSAGQPSVTETFNVDAFGNVFSAGAVSAPFFNDPAGTSPSLLARLNSDGGVQRASITDTTGLVGVVLGNPGPTGFVEVAYSGIVNCAFDGQTVAGHYVVASTTSSGFCSDGGSTYPSGGQVLGRILRSTAGGPVPVPILMFGPETRGLAGGTLTRINTGAGLTGGPITSSGSISIADSGVTNSMLQNNSITVADGPGIGGGGTVPLGGFVTITNLGALSFNGRVGDISPALGDYNFSQISGTVTESQLPPSVVLNTQNNTLNGDQNVNGTVTITGAVPPANNFAPFSALLSVNDTATQAGSHPAFLAGSNTNQAAFFFSNGPSILVAGTMTHGVLSVKSLGVDVNGALTATSFAGDGSGLSNVAASKIGTLGPADIATTTALNSEASTRQSGDTTLQNNINSETTARLSDEAALQASVAAETSARQSDVSNLQASINNVSAADAKLAASNTFTAGTQDFSGAGATLPVRALLTANTPAACVASKELLIKSDAPAGQQLFICNATGDGWNLVGDGAAGGVTAFNGRSGNVTPTSGDYSFAQISGSASTAQLPASTVYSNQVNTFTASQTVNGTLTASSFNGNGSGLSNVNAVTLSGIPANAIAQLNAINTFTAEQVLSASTAVNPSLNMPAGSAPATPLAGDVWNTGTVLQYRDNASTTRSLVSTTQTGGLQLLKLTASITPANVNPQNCSEQSFSVSGIGTGDVLLRVQQPSTVSPGTNIAIGGFRVSAANTVAVQFCNVSRNTSTPVSGTYTFALMR